HRGADQITARVYLDRTAVATGQVDHGIGSQIHRTVGSDRDRAAAARRLVTTDHRYLAHGAAGCGYIAPGFDKNISTGNQAHALDSVGVEPSVEQCVASGRDVDRTRLAVG